MTRRGFRIRLSVATLTLLLIFTVVARYTANRQSFGYLGDRYGAVVHLRSRELSITFIGGGEERLLSSDDVLISMSLGWVNDVQLSLFRPREQDWLAIAWGQSLPFRGARQTPWILPKSYFVTIRYWLPVVISALAVLLSLKKKKERVFSSRCRTCGHDLHAAPVRCPECGAFPPASPHDTSSAI